MDKKNYRDILEKGIEHQNKKDYKLALEYYNQIPKKNKYFEYAQHNIGTSLYKTGKFKESIEVLRQIQTNTETYSSAIIYIGQNFEALGDYSNALNEYQKLRKEHIYYDMAQHNIALVLITLKKYNDALTYLEKISITYQYYDETQYEKGLILATKYNNITEACECFLIAKTPIIKILKALNNTLIAIVITSKILDKVGDSHFTKTLGDKNIDIETREIYKNIYLESLDIVSRLQVNSGFEKKVAHYTKPYTANILLLGVEDAEKKIKKDSNLQLGTIVTANDPKEGITLFDFLEINEEYEMQCNNYQAFMSCFTFDLESLNQFRLYGKDKEIEATGVSIVMKSDFFNQELDIKAPIWDAATQTNDKKENRAKETLFRCIYVDPKTTRVISVGQKESYSLYREFGREFDISKYQTKIQELEATLQEKLDDLKKLIDENKAKLDMSIVRELLIMLRYLVKHVAFKEEQECRIIQIEKLGKDNPKIKYDEARNAMYTEYLPIRKFVDRLVVAPNFDKFNIYRDRIKHELGIDVERCTHPFASK